MEFRLLGRFGVEADGIDLTPARPKQRALLALLLLRAGEVVPTDDLVDALWGERPPPTAQSALHGHVSALRKRLGAERIETRPPGYLLHLDEDELDVRRLDRLVGEARANGPAARADKLRQALTLFRGEPLTDFRYETFARQEAARLEELRLAVVEEQVEADLELGRHLEVVPELERLLAEHPLRERLRALLGLALYRAGRQADALHVLREGRTVLAAELGIDPSPALQRLERQILNQDPELAAADLFAPARQRATETRPTGIVTFLAVAVEGRRRLERGPLGADQASLSDLVERAARPRGGFEVESDGDSFLVAFGRARDAAAAAVELQRAKSGAPLRIGAHSAEATATDDGYAGIGMHAAMSVCRAANGGQILLSRTTRDLLRESPLDETNIRDLGEHRLSDLAPPQRIFQLVAPGLESDFPPPRALQPSHTNLPSQPSLVGRRTELADVIELLGSSAGTLVTLTGAAGTGKTRLAAQVAAELLDDFADGVLLVELAPLPESQLVLPGIARTLGIRESAGDALATALNRHLEDRRLLLVLDNFEHVLGAAGAVAELAASASAARVLVTSRAPLRVPGERIYPVMPLKTPDADDDVATLAQIDSVALLMSRARAVRPDFALTAGNARAVAEVCKILDGLPLAIELAATRVGVLPPQVLLERLDQRLKILSARKRDLPARHRTLRAAIDWSHDLLEPEEQQLFARLSGFAGGCTLESAERVCGDDLDVVDGLASLVEMSLVRAGGPDAEPRFTMLETIREYAAEQLAASGEADELRSRHADCYLALAEAAEPYLRGQPGEWLDRLEQEQDNLRTALDWLQDSGEGERALRLAGALWRFWYLAGRLTEGRRYLESALAADHRPTPSRAKALIGMAVMAVNTSDTDTARHCAEEGIALHQLLDDAWGAAYSTLMLAGAVGQAGDLSRAQTLRRESMEAFRELGDEHSALLAARNLARTYEDVGELSRAQALHEDNLRRARETGNARIEASTLGALAMLALGEGRVDDAEAMLKEGLHIHHALGDILDTAVDLCRAAFILAFEGKGDRAACLLASFDALGERVGNRRAAVAALNAQTLSTIRTQLDDGAFAAACQEGRALTIADAVALAVDSLS